MQVGNDIEKGLPERRTPPKSGEGHNVKAERKPSLQDEFQPEAKVWHVYLEDAEREAKEQAEVWKTGLDSLLIFVG